MLFRSGVTMIDLIITRVDVDPDDHKCSRRCLDSDPGIARLELECANTKVDEFTAVILKHADLDANEDGAICVSDASRTTKVRSARKEFAA